MGYKFIADPGHGWLRVPKAEVVGLDVYVSAFSYQDDEYVYLEEDYDAWNWMQFSGVQNHDVTEHDYTGEWVRDLPRFSQPGTKYC